MLLGLIAAVIIAGLNTPLATFLAGRVKTPGGFLLTYMPLGLISVVLGFVVLSLFLVFNAGTYWLVGLLVYASIGGSKFKELKRAREADAA